MLQKYALDICSLWWTAHMPVIGFAQNSWPQLALSQFSSIFSSTFQSLVHSQCWLIVVSDGSYFSKSWKQPAFTPCQYFSFEVLKSILFPPFSNITSVSHPIFLVIAVVFITFLSSWSHSEILNMNVLCVLFLWVFQLQTVGPTTKSANKTSTSDFLFLTTPVIDSLLGCDFINFRLNSNWVFLIFLISKMIFIRVYWYMINLLKVPLCEAGIQRKVCKYDHDIEQLHQPQNCC